MNSVEDEAVGQLLLIVANNLGMNFDTGMRLIKAAFEEEFRETVRRALSCVGEPPPCSWSR